MPSSVICVSRSTSLMDIVEQQSKLFHILRHPKRFSHSERVAAYANAVGWALSVVSIAVALLLRSSLFTWLTVIFLEVASTVNMMIVVFMTMEYHSKAADAGEVTSLLNASLGMVMPLRVLQCLLLLLALGSYVTCLLVLLPPLVFDIVQRVRGAYFVDPTTFWRVSADFDRKAKLRLCCDCVTFIWLLCAMLISLLS